MSGRGGRLGWMARALVPALLSLSAAGCRHKPVTAAIPLPPPKQLPVDTTAKVEHQPVMAPVPVPVIPLTTVTVPTKKVKKPKKAIAATVPPPVTPPTTQVASAAPMSEADVIGALTPGGSDIEQQHRDAQDLIAQLEKRLADLSADTKKKQREQLMRVKSFEREAQVALNAGDADGAWTLATKAKLLLDDLVK